MKVSSSRLFKIVLGLSAALSFAPFATAQAVETPAAPTQFYAGIGAGAIFPQDLSYTANVPVIGTLKMSVNGHIKFNTGPVLDLFGGYHVNPWLDVEGDFQYCKLDYDSMTASTALLPGLGVNLGTSGHTDDYNFMANAILKPQVNWTNLSPYVGGGIGLASMKSSIDNVSFGGTTYVVNTSHSETDFAANLLLGLNYTLNTQTSFELRYQLLYISKADDDLISGTGGKTTYGSLWAHALTVSAVYHF